MVKKSQITNDESSSPRRSLKRQNPTENARTTRVSSSASTSRLTSSTASKTPTTRSSVRKRRSIAKADAMEDGSDSDCTPPLSILSKSSMEKRPPGKRKLKKSSSEKAENEVIDLTYSRTLSTNLSRKRPKVRPVDLDSFINLCSDEETNPQPPKKRKVIPAEEVIFISSGDEAELPVDRLFSPLEHAAEAQVSNEEHPMEHSALDTDPIVSDTHITAETHHSNPTPNPTPPPVSPPENNSPEFAILDITTSESMTGIEEIPEPKISQDPLNTLHQESLPAGSSTSEECHPSSFCKIPVLEPKLPLRKIIYADKPAKPALVTSFFFARAMRSLGTTRPKADETPQSPNSSTVVAHIEPRSENRDDISQNIVLDIPASISPPSSTETLHTNSVSVPCLDKSSDITPHEDLSVSDQSPEAQGRQPSATMEVDELESAFSTQLNATGSSTPVTALPSSCMDKRFPKDVPSMETLVKEHALTKECDTPTFSEEQESDHHPHATPHLEVGSKAESVPISEKPKVLPGVADIILRHCKCTSPPPATCVSPLSTSVEEQVEDIRVQSCETRSNTREISVPTDVPVIHASPDTHLLSRDVPPHGISVDSQDNSIAIDPAGNSLLRNTSPSLTSQSFQTININPSIFEFEHLPNLTLQILFASNKILDDDSDLAISLPSYPEPMYY